MRHSEKTHLKKDGVAFYRFFFPVSSNLFRHPQYFFQKVPQREGRSIQEKSLSKERGRFLPFLLPGVKQFVSKKWNVFFSFYIRILIIFQDIQKQTLPPNASPVPFIGICLSSRYYSLITKTSRAKIYFFFPRTIHILTISTVYLFTPLPGIRERHLPGVMILRIFKILFYNIVIGVKFSKPRH